MSTDSILALAYVAAAVAACAWLAWRLAWWQRRAGLLQREAEHLLGLTASAQAMTREVLAANREASGLLDRHRRKLMRLHAVACAEYDVHEVAEALDKVREVLHDG